MGVAAQVQGHHAHGRAKPCGAVEDDLFVRGDLAEVFIEFPQGDVEGPKDVAGPVLRRLAHIDQQGVTARQLAFQGWNRPERVEVCREGMQVLVHGALHGRGPLRCRRR